MRASQNKAIGDPLANPLTILRLEGEKKDIVSLTGIRVWQTTLGSLQRTETWAGPSGSIADGGPEEGIKER